MAGRYIRVHNKMVHLDSISYVDFLDSGRAMIFMRGLTQEKQNISVDPEETVKLRAALEADLAVDQAPSVPPVPSRPTQPAYSRF